MHEIPINNTNINAIDNDIESKRDDDKDVLEDELDKLTNKSRIEKLTQEVNRLEEQANNELHRLQVSDEITGKTKDYDEQCSKLDFKIPSTNGNIVLKKQIQDLRGEVEEMNITIIEKTEQIQEFRIKYLQALEQVSVLKRRIEVMLYDNEHVDDDIATEIKNTKKYFEKKILELAPLPELLKGAHIEIEKAQKLQKLAEEYADKMSHEVFNIGEQLSLCNKNREVEKVQHEKIAEENKMLRAQLIDKDGEIDKLKSCMQSLKSTNNTLEEKLQRYEKSYKEILEEYIQLCHTVEGWKIERDKSLKRDKERNDAMKRSVNAHVTELERQLIQARENCIELQKDRNDLRRNLQFQVTALKEQFTLMEKRFQNIISQVYKMKNAYDVLYNSNNFD